MGGGGGLGTLDRLGARGPRAASYRGAPLPNFELHVAILIFRFSYFELHVENFHTSAFIFRASRCDLHCASFMRPASVFQFRGSNFILRVSCVEFRTSNVRFGNEHSAFQSHMSNSATSFGVRVSNGHFRSESGRSGEHLIFAPRICLSTSVARRLTISLPQRLATGARPRLLRGQLRRQPLSFFNTGSG